MIILEKPYVSDFLIETIKNNNFLVLDNEIARKYLDEKYIVDDAGAANLLKKEDIYSNSENSINWAIEKSNNPFISSMIKISKDKVLFREKIKEIYPDYFFKKVLFSDLKKINPAKIKFPVILKPSVGFLSFGVYPVKNINQWEKVISKLKEDIEKTKNIFPENVVNYDNFILEEMIEGDEYALDAYFDENGNATILNIFKHLFFDENDVSDRLYFTSSEIIKSYHDKFKALLDKIGYTAGYKNFPFHLELRANDNQIIPIELNPMRFCGWCITDIAYYAWGINVYEYYFKKLKPDWESILKNNNDIYYFTIGDISSDIKKQNIKNIDYDKYLKNISNPVEIRKIDYKNNPVFIIVFAKTRNIDEMKNILKLDMRQFINL